ncbi:MAG: AAA family ATPase, partial [Desulfurococcales archaeon]|nr:AAA family ATPase [Desulfurococcales archaeon]
LKQIVNQFSKKFGGIILYGSPGTGKTYWAIKFVKNINGNSEFITFHKSYGYEEFVEGIWPEVENGVVTYVIRDGIFKKLAIEAIYSGMSHNNEENSGESGGRTSNGEEDVSYRDKKEKVQECLKSIVEGGKSECSLRFNNAPKYFLIIDEINRGDLSRIFGELITLLEPDKRLSMSNQVNQVIVRLPYSGELFAVPPNLYIIGTMNSTDRSIALVDYALRRRFAFIELSPQPELLEDREVDGLSLKKLLERLNKEIGEKLGKDFEIGHSYFLGVNSNEALHAVWYYQIVPLLREYFYTSSDELRRIFRSIEELYDPSKARAVDPGRLVGLLKEWVGGGEG